jgi:uncharacterized SAM-binding protein YcdF (DUF218 family)
MKRARYLLVPIVVAGIIFIATSGRFLVVDTPQRADVIVVLAGETDHRPARALELLAQGLSPKVLIDVPVAGKIFGHDISQLAQDYVQALPERQAVSLCPIVGLSTKTETRDVAKCLEPIHPHKVLLVTSDYHTRRALSTFRHEVRQYEFSAAAATDRQQFDPSWWRRRQWAKQNFDEWVRLVWWEMVDRWR